MFRNFFYFIFITFIFFSNFVYANEKKEILGYANEGYKCKLIEDQEDILKDNTAHIGFFKDENFSFRLKWEEKFFEDKMFGPFFETTPIYFASVKDDFYSLSDVRIWFRFFFEGKGKGYGPNDKLIDKWGYEIFYFDEDEGKHFYAASGFTMKDKKDQRNKKLAKYAKNLHKYLLINFKDNPTDTDFKKMQKGYIKNNKLIFDLLGGLETASKYKQYGLITGYLFECEEMLE